MGPQGDNSLLTRHFALLQSARLAAVQAPVIPIVGRWTAETPGTISLGQGIVSYGPPPEAMQALAAFGGDARPIIATGRSKGWPRSSRRSKRSCARERHRRAAGEPRGRDRRRQPGVRERGARDHRSGRRDHPAGAVLLQSRDGDRDRGRGAGRRADDARLPARRRGDRRARSRRGRGRSSRSRRTTRPARSTRKRRCARSTRSAASAASSTSTTRPTSTSPTTPRRTSRRARSPAPPATRSRCSRCRRRYGMASWRIGYMVIPGRPVRTPSTRSRTRCSSARRPSRSTRRSRRSRVGRDYPRRHTRRDSTHAPRHLRGAERPGRPLRRPVGGRRLLLSGARALDARLDDAGRAPDPRAPVATIPGSAFADPAACSIRISYGALEPDAIAEGLERLVGGLKALRR